MSKNLTKFLQVLGVVELDKKVEDFEKEFYDAIKFLYKDLETNKEKMQEKFTDNTV